MKKNLILAMLLTALFFSLNAYGAELEIDQGQEETSYGFWFDNTVVRWQELRPFYSSLSKVDIFIQKNGNPGALAVSIKNSSGETVWDIEIPEYAVPDYGWLELPVTPSIPVVPHSPLYIHVRSTQPSPDVANRYAWIGKTESEYYRGVSSVENSWPDYDFAFRTWSDTEVNGQTCFIYEDDLAGAQSYMKFLNANGYPTTLIPMGDAAEADFSPCALILTGSDTGDAYTWGTPAAVERIRTSGKPVLGLGAGGASLFQNLDLSINWGNGWVGTKNSIYVENMTDEIFHEPYNIYIPHSGIIQLYTETRHIGEYAPNLGSGVILLGREADDQRHYPLVQEGNNILWGFHSSPDDMTNTGRKLFLNTVYRLAAPPPPALYLSLNIEDALEGIPVNKLAGDEEGPTHYTRLEIVTKIFSLTPSARTDIPVVLKVENDLLGVPYAVYVRDTDGSPRTATIPTNPGYGQYKVTTDLAPVYLLPWMPRFYRKQIVWCFLIPNDLSPQDITIEAELEIPAMDPDSAGTVRILAPGTPQTIIIANRRLLYEKYAENQVSSLLQRLFTEAQGHPYSHSPTAVIYYVERYDARAFSWDDTTVNYTSEATANTTANAIDALIEDWQDDATRYFDWYVPYIGYLHLPAAFPRYLLIAGGDDTIPFYRYNDPSNEEATWHVTSATNPTIRATDHDYILTDNPYGDISTVPDWRTGDVELWTGRLLGDSAADMLNLLSEGVDWNNGRRGGAVMASVDGWELGLEPDDGRGGEIADLTDATSLLRGKGFAVRNDDSPAAEVRTIDVMSPYEGGSNSWNSDFRDAANNSGGMDLFLIGGHDSYDHAVIPGDNFSPDDTPNDYTRFGIDHPVVMIVGCHGGLPVLDIDVPGGADHSMVYDLIHEGARAYIGATGFSYGSPNNLHKCTWGERLIQRFFLNLTTPGGSNSMALGKALAEAKQNFTFGLASNDALDRKTVTEFNLYGVPWSFIFYPNAMSRGEADDPGGYLSGALEGTISAGDDEGIYTQIVEFNLADFQVQREIQDDEKYDIFSIEGGHTAISPDAPVLPFLKVFSMPLPPEAEIQDVRLVEATPEFVGEFNIPIARVAAFSEGGISYTTRTDINSPFPADPDLVQYQRTTEGINITLFPIQHNPTTDETWFYQRGAVQVTYQAPRTINITEFSTDRPGYRPGEAVNTRCVVANIGDSKERVKGLLQLKNSRGEIVGAETTEACSIAPGGACVLETAAWIEAIPDGAYSAHISVQNSEEATVAQAAAEFSVVTGEIIDLSVPETLHDGETGIFRVSFVSYSPDPVTGQALMSIHNSEGAAVAELAPIKIRVEPNEETEAVFQWSPNVTGAGAHTAAAKIIINDNEYGPSTRTFQVEVELCLGNLDGDQDLDGFDLSVFAGEYAHEGCVPPCPADLDGDGVVNEDDLEIFADKFGKTTCP
jgi:hypothetical protein